MDNQLLKASQVIKMLNVSIPFFKKYILGKIPAIKLGEGQKPVWRFRKWDVEKFLQNKTWDRDAQAYEAYKRRKNREKMKALLAEVIREERRAS